MLRIIRPEIPLNPPNWLSIIFNNEDMRGLGAINSWAVFSVNSFQIEGLTPPDSNVGGGQPLLK
jgi:hypothetical protein